MSQTGRPTADERGANRPVRPNRETDDETPFWRRNLVVCVFGSFTTIVAMTLLLPFLPLYVEQLGVRGHAAIVQWSGIAYGATFLSAGPRRARFGGDSPIATGAS